MLEYYSIFYKYQSKWAQYQIGVWSISIGIDVSQIRGVEFFLLHSEVVKRFKTESNVTDFLWVNFIPYSCSAWLIWRQTLWYSKIKLSIRTPKWLQSHIISFIKNLESHFQSHSLYWNYVIILYDPNRIITLQKLSHHFIEYRPQWRCFILWVTQDKCLLRIVIYNSGYSLEFYHCVYNKNNQK